MRPLRGSQHRRAVGSRVVGRLANARSCRGAVIERRRDVLSSEATIFVQDQHLLIRSRVSAATVAFAGVRTAGHAHSAGPQPSPRVRRRTPAALSKLLSILSTPSRYDSRGVAQKAARDGTPRS